MSAAPRGQLRPILVVDDNEFNRSVLVKQMSALGYAAEQVGDGEEALRLGAPTITRSCSRTARCRAWTGSRSLARCGRRRPARPGASRVPIVAWTANVMPDDVEACLSAGMDDVLAKPSALSTVQRVLETWIDAKAQTAPLIPVPLAASDRATSIRSIGSNCG